MALRICYIGINYASHVGAEVRRTRGNEAISFEPFIMPIHGVL